MQIITLTTDLGIKDHYVAAVKAEIYNGINEANIVDISNMISKFDIQQAAYIFKSCYKNFPENTIHIISVNDELTNENPYLAIEYKKQFIIGPDNGIFSLIFNEIMPDRIFQINIDQDTNLLTFAAKDIFVKVACHIARGGTLEMIGTKVNHFHNTVTSLKPVIEKNTIRGIVLNIDSYGNCITNINVDTFKDIGLGRSFSIIYGNENEKIDKIHEKYKDQMEGERLAMFTSDGLLEISINQGRASSLLGIQLFDSIRIEFKL